MAFFLIFGLQLLYLSQAKIVDDFRPSPKLPPFPSPLQIGNAIQYSTRHSVPHQNAFRFNNVKNTNHHHNHQHQPPVKKAEQIVLGKNLAQGPSSTPSTFFGSSTPSSHFGFSLGGKNLFGNLATPSHPLSFVKPSGGPKRSVNNDNIPPKQEDEDPMTFVVRNSFSFGPSSIQIAVPDENEVIEDNGLLTLKTGKSELNFFKILFNQCDHLPTLIFVVTVRFVSAEIFQKVKIQNLLKCDKRNFL